MTIFLNKNLNEKYYVQLYKNIKKEIDNKNIKQGEKLYSIRSLCLKYNISMTTVLQAYGLLEKINYIEKIPGKGCYVKKNSPIIENQVKPIIDTFRYGQIEKGENIDFSIGIPSLEYFPVKLYKKLMNRVIKNNGANLLQYQNVQGLESLRSIFAIHLEKDDIFITKDEVLITSGTQQSLDIILKIFSDLKEKNIVLSNPTYPNALNIFRNDCKIISIDLKHDGWDMEEFEEILKKEKIDLVYEIINFHNPTGVSWSENKKKKLLELAIKYNFYIIEDDSFSGFYYTENKQNSLKSIDRVGKERVIYIRTFSKTIMPGMGMAVMIIPPKLLEKMILIKYSLDTTTSGLNQKILEIFLKEGYLEKHMRKMRKIFKFKYKFMLKILLNIPNIKIMHIPKGGFFFWIQLSDKIDGEIFYNECKENGVFILPGMSFYKDGRMASKIRLSFIYESLEKIELGMRILEKILMKY